MENTDKQLTISDLLEYQKILNRPIKGTNCLFLTIIFLIGVGLGIYYWFFDNIIFQYTQISPFLGFVIFSISGLLISLLFMYLGSLLYKSYNKEIENTIKLLERKIENESEPEEILNLCKKILIEYKIDHNELSPEEYQWHSTHYCWGCGKEIRPSETRFYNHTIKKQETWKENALRHYQDFSKTIKVPVCNNCYYELQISNTNSQKNDHIIKIVNVVICILTIAIIVYFEYREENFWSTILNTLLTSLGVIVIIYFTPVKLVSFFISYLISLPFMKNKEFKTKWNFNKIPEVKHFFKHDCHTTSD